MICTNCKASASLRAILRTRTDLSEHIRRTLTATADEGHARCRGGTWCACQHKTPPLVSTF